MEAIINQIHRRLLKSKKTVAVAESCTGGFLSALLTRLPGSSAYFILGTVVYSNQAKTKILGIPSRLIKHKGAVSREVCRSMAKAARKLSAANIAISITGIAGPSGGTAAKPVGTVFIGIDTAAKTICKKFIFKGSRSGIRNQSCQKALEMLKNII